VCVSASYRESCYPGLNQAVLPKLALAQIVVDQGLARKAEFFGRMREMENQDKIRMFTIGISRGVDKTGGASDPMTLEPAERKNV
jgi:hypothetical protein